MIEKLINFLHVAPLILICGLMISNTILKLITKKNMDLSSTILLLSSIGIASGFGSHHNRGDEFSLMCYLCFGYAIVLALIGLKWTKVKKISESSRLS